MNNVDYNELLNNIRKTKELINSLIYSTKRKILLTEFFEYLIKDDCIYRSKLRYLFNDKIYFKKFKSLDINDFLYSFNTQEPERIQAEKILNIKKTGWLIRNSSVYSDDKKYYSISFKNNENDKISNILFHYDYNEKLWVYKNDKEYYYETFLHLFSYITIKYDLFFHNFIN